MSLLLVLKNHRYLVPNSQLIRSPNDQELAVHRVESERIQGQSSASLNEVPQAEPQVRRAGILVHTQPKVSGGWLMKRGTGLLKMPLDPMLATSFPPSVRMVNNVRFSKLGLISFRGLLILRPTMAVTVLTVYSLPDELVNLGDLSTIL